MTLRSRVILLLTPGKGPLSRELRSRARRIGIVQFAQMSTKGVRLEGSTRVHPIRTLRTPTELAAAQRTGSRGEPLVIHWEGDRVIPLEGALAGASAHQPIWVVSDAVEELPAALGALERGADAVLVRIERPEQLRRLEELLDEPRVGRLNWRSVRVRRVEPVGLGDRVLVDTTSLLRAEEGLLVGSRAAFLFAVTSEAVGSHFSRPRPFRVNAGSAHSYVLLSDGSTRYLSELEPGDSVLIARCGYPPRSVRVGRIKIERRPLVLVEAEQRGTHPTIFLQEAETVRLAGAGGGTRPVTQLGPGDRVRGVLLPPGRHLGATVEEFVEER